MLSPQHLEYMEQGGIVPGDLVAELETVIPPDHLQSPQAKAQGD